MTMKRDEEDMHLWKEWKKSPTTDNLSALMLHMKPLIYKATQSAHGSLSPAIIDAEAKIQALSAFKTFDPSRDVKLSTHVTNYLPKVNRLNYKYQEIFSVPENRRIKYTTFLDAQSLLKEKMGRDPTAEELAEELHWSRAEVSRYFSEQKNELSDSQPVHSDMYLNTSKDDALLSYVYHDLHPTHKSLFEHLTGYNSKKVLTPDEIQKKLKMTQGQFYYARNLIKDQVKNVMGRFV